MLFGDLLELLVGVFGFHGLLLGLVDGVRMNALFPEEAKLNLRSSCFFLESVGNTDKCPAALPLPVDTRVALKWWLCPVTATHTGP
jgi:hypothetical protein